MPFQATVFCCAPKPCSSQQALLVGCRLQHWSEQHCALHYAPLEPAAYRSARLKVNEDLRVCEVRMMVKKLLLCPQEGLQHLEDTATCHSYVSGLLWRGVGAADGPVAALCLRCLYTVSAAV